jgi:hypothetical protein
MVGVRRCRLLRRYSRGRRCSMKRRIMLLVVMALLALSLFAPAAIARDDDRVASGAGRALPRTDGLALIAPIAGALLIGGSVAGGIALSRSRDDS